MFSFLKYLLLSNLVSSPLIYTTIGLIIAVTELAGGGGRRPQRGWEETMIVGGGSGGRREARL